MNTSHIKISTVIPCFNVENYIEECVRSVVDQSYVNKEIICIDDGSTDRTLSILQRLKITNSIELKIISGSRHGACSARNQGLQHANGEYIQFLDADDLLFNNKYEHQINLLGNSELLPDLIVAGYKVKTLKNEINMLLVSNSDPWVSLINSTLGITSSNLWRRSFLVNIGGWNEQQLSSQEVELMFRMLKNGANLIFDNEPLTLIRKREGSISTSVSENKWIQFINLRMSIHQYLQKNNLLTKKRNDSIMQAIYMAIQSLHKIDPQLSLKYHKELLPSNFRPYKYSRSHRIFYKLLGYEWLERLKKLLKGNQK